MSIFRDLVAGLEQFDRDATALVTRVVIGDLHVSNHEGQDHE